MFRAAADLALALPITANAATPVTRINCGGDRFVDPCGRIWEGDSDFNGGTIELTPNTVTGTPIPTVYQTGRWSMETLRYSILAEDDHADWVAVVLHFAEIFPESCEEGGRIFDVTTRNARLERTIQRRIDELELRIDELRTQEEIDRLRPPIDGNDVMAHLGLTPGPRVGAAMKLLLEHRIDDGPYSPEEAYELLDSHREELEGHQEALLA